MTLHLISLLLLFFPFGLFNFEKSLSFVLNFLFTDFSNFDSFSHSIIMFLNPVLLALLQVEYQFQKVSPFQTHLANVWGFLAATCFYCLGLGLKMHIKSRCAILGHVLLISGAFSSVSLVSIFLPRSLGWLPFIIWAILPFMIGRPLLMRVYRWLYQEILKVILQVGNFFGRFMGPTTVQQQYLPE